MELIRKYILPKVPMYSKKLSVCEIENQIKNIGYITMKCRKSCLKRNQLNLDRFGMQIGMLWNLKITKKI